MSRRKIDEINNKFNRLVSILMGIGLTAVVVRELVKTYFGIQSLVQQAVKETGKHEKSEKSFLIPESPKVSFKDLVGFEKIKEELKSALEWPLKYRSLIKDYDVEPINGICLFGPPGCGKTYFVKCAAGQFNVNLFLASPSTIGSMWYGQTEKRIRKLFKEARKHSPSIIAIDEADKLLPRSSSSSVHPRILSEFLQNLDGLLSEEKPVIVILMTNEPWKIHDAIIRRGRINRIIYVPPPDYESRIQLFKHYMAKCSQLVDDSIDYEELGKLTEPSERGYYSSAAIREITRTAKEEALSEAISTGVKKKITMKHLKAALLKVPPDIIADLIPKYEKWAIMYSSYIS